jgi:hypothetical protein
VPLKTYALGFLLLWGTLTAVAQDSYSPGKVYTPEGDTLAGFINSQRTARYVRFKSAAGNVTEYRSNQLTGFELEGSVYQRLEVEINGTDGIARKEAVFMQLLVSGKVNLYQYKETDTDEHYWARKGDQQYELRVIKRIVKRDGKDYLLEAREYHNILTFLFMDCPRMKSREYEFSRKSLMDAVFSYNTCHENEKANIVYKREKRRIHPGVKGGLNALSQTYSNRGYGSLAGVFLELPFIGASRVISGQFEVVRNQYNTANIRYAYQYRIIDVGVFLKYTAPKGWVRPFIMGGIVRGSGNLRITESASRSSYEVNRGRMIKFAAETGLQVPLSKHYAYTSLRYDVMLNNRLDKFRIFHLAFAFGF